MISRFNNRQISLFPGSYWPFSLVIIAINLNVQNWSIFFNLINHMKLMFDCSLFLKILSSFQFSTFLFVCFLISYFLPNISTWICNWHLKLNMAKVKPAPLVFPLLVFGSSLPTVAQAPNFRVIFDSFLKISHFIYN